MTTFLQIMIFFVMMIFLIVKMKKALHMLQQNLYNMNQRYVKWIAKNWTQIFSLFDLSALLLLMIAWFQKGTIQTILLILVLILYIAGSVVIVSKRKYEQTKKPLVITKRVRRLIYTTTLLYLIPVIFYLCNHDWAGITLIVDALLISLNFLVILVSNVINKPWEKGVYLYYETHAKRKLKNMTNLKVVGITGSYGKTSSKNILNDILNIKFISRPTPKNLNTEYGLMITINNHLDKFDEIFIAEMGAYKVGEIKKLCDMVHPKYGILTRIGTAHLETFGSEENIENTKFELIESLPADGVGVLNGDDPKQLHHKIKSPCKKVWIGIDNEEVDVRALNIKCNHKGSNFDVKFKNDPELYHFETRLLGNHNIYNILAGIALGREFGISIPELVQGVRKVRPIEHRLEIKKLGVMYQIDDAYNSNPVGAKMALDVLSMMPGTKVVVTPGMVELGEKEDEYNREFGRQIAKVADYTILVGEKKTKPIYEGLIEQGYNEDQIIILNDVKEAYTMVNSLKGTEDIYALFENDLPDTYNEK